MNFEENYLESSIRIFKQYRVIGEKAMAQVPDHALFEGFENDDNSIAIIVQHLAGNMLSRWTDFLTTDGEKDWRNRNSEFETSLHTKQEVTEKWNQGWDLFLQTLDSLQSEDMEKTVFIRAEAHTVMEAMNRQIAHYAYHIGQIVMFSKHFASQPWQSMSIPKNKSKEFNNEKMNKA